MLEKTSLDLAFTPDGNRAYVTSEVDGTVWVIDVPTKKVLKVIDASQGFEAYGRSGVAPTGSESSWQTAAAERYQSLMRPRTPLSTQSRWGSGRGASR